MTRFAAQGKKSKFRPMKESAVFVLRSWSSKDYRKGVQNEEYVNGKGETLNLLENGGGRSAFSS